MAKSVYRRVVVKVSGEALMGPDSFGIHQPTLERIAADQARNQVVCQIGSDGQLAAVESRIA